MGKHYDNHDCESNYCRHDRYADRCDICNTQGTLVDKVVCSKNIYSTAELALPLAVEVPGGGLLAGLLALLPAGLRVTVTPVYNAVRQEVTVLRDAVMIFGTLPVDLNIELGAVVAGFPLTVRVQLYFQNIVECPGACPGDRVTLTDPVVEPTLNQPLIAAGPDGSLVVNLLLFKAVIQTNVTLSRRGIEKNGCIYELEPNNVRDPQTINTPYRLSPTTIPPATP